MVLYRLAHGAEDDARLLQRLLVGGGDGNAVQHGVHGHAGQPFPLLEGDAQLVEGLQDLGVDLVQALGGVAAGGGGVVVDVLVVDGVVVNVGPGRLLVLEPLPVPEGLEPPLQQPLGLFLLGRDEAYDVLAEPLGGQVGVDVDGEAPLVIGVELSGGGVAGNDPGSGHRLLLAREGMPHGSRPGADVVKNAGCRTCGNQREG